MFLYLIIGGFFFTAIGLWWQFRLRKYETKHLDARGLLQFHSYNGDRLHEQYKTWAGLIKTVGVLLFLAAIFLYLALS